MGMKLATPAGLPEGRIVNGLHPQTVLNAPIGAKRVSRAVTNPPTRTLVRYNTARRALAAVHRVDEVKSIRDKAVAMQAYAVQAKDTTLITQATEIRLRAERRAGELLIEMAARKERETKGGDRRSKSRPATLSAAPKLADLGINKTQSSRWQALAALDPEQFEDKVESTSKRAYDSMTYRFLKAAEIERGKQRHGKTIEHGCRVDDLVALAEAGKRFGVIYADPPWPWETWGGASGKIMSAPDNHYGTSSLDEIMKLPVAAPAAEDCALLMWCTGPHITIGTCESAWGPDADWHANVLIILRLEGSNFGAYSHKGGATAEHVYKLKNINMGDRSMKVLTVAMLVIAMFGWCATARANSQQCQQAIAAHNARCSNVQAGSAQAASCAAEAARLANCR